jgi:hypothetical protein
MGAVVVDCAIFLTSRAVRPLRAYEMLHGTRRQAVWTHPKRTVHNRRRNLRVFSHRVTKHRCCAYTSSGGERYQRAKDSAAAAFAVNNFRFFVLLDSGQTLMRQSGGSFTVPEVWNGSEWSEYARGLHAITGVGEDPWSQGEWADEISEEMAQKIAADRGIDLYAADRTQDDTKIERSADVDLTDFPDRTPVKHFEGGVVYAATRAGKSVLIFDESTMSDLLDEDDRNGRSFVRVIEFQNETERQKYIERRFH